MGRTRLSATRAATSGPMGQFASPQPEDPSASWTRTITLSTRRGYTVRQPSRNSKRAPAAAPALPL